MRMIEVTDIPFGTAPRHFRKSLVGLKLEASDPPEDPLIDCLPGERSSPGFCVPISAVVKNLEGTGHAAAASYFKNLQASASCPYSHLLINEAACIPA